MKQFKVSMNLLSVMNGEFSEVDIVINLNLMVINTNGLPHLEEEQNLVLEMLQVYYLVFNLFWKRIIFMLLLLHNAKHSYFTGSVQNYLIGFWQRRSINRGVKRCKF